MKFTTRIPAALLVLITFTTNCVFGYQPEKNIWEERHQLLSLNTSSSRQSLSRDPLESTKLDPGLRHAGVTDLRIPADITRFGSIRKILKPAGPSKGTIVHIQDIHRNAEAQTNIGLAVRDLIAKDSAAVVALEGTSEAIDLSRFQIFPDRTALNMVADYLLRNGEMSGAVFAGIQENSRAAFIGIDDAIHYQANVAAYRAAAQDAPTLEKELNANEQNLNKEKSAAFNASLRSFDAAAQRFHDNQMKLGEFARLLARRAVQQPPHFRDFLAALELESSLDFGRIERERSQLLERLVLKLGAREANDLMERSVAYRSGQSNPADFYSYLQTLCREKNVPLKNYPAMNTFIRYTLAAENLDVEKVLQEISQLENSTYETLATTKREKELAKESKQLRLTKKLVDFSMTKEEWEEYKAFTIDDLRITILKPFKDFYSEAENRDERMATNFLNQKPEIVNRKLSVLVTGGFHSSGIDRRLVDAGFTVVSFTPKITKIDANGGSGYLSVFSQAKTPLASLFDGQKLFLAENPKDALVPLAIGSAALSKNPEASIKELGVPAEIQVADATSEHTTGIVIDEGKRKEVAFAITRDASRIKSIEWKESTVVGPVSYLDLFRATTKQHWEIFHSLQTWPKSNFEQFLGFVIRDLRAYLVTNNPISNSRYLPYLTFAFSAGSMAGWIYAVPESGKIHAIEVAETYRGKGIGVSLVMRAVREMVERELDSNIMIEQLCQRMIENIEKFFPIRKYLDDNHTAWISLKNAREFLKNYDLFVIILNSLRKYSLDPKMEASLAKFVMRIGGDSEQKVRHVLADLNRYSYEKRFYGTWLTVLKRLIELSPFLMTLPDAWNEIRDTLDKWLRAGSRRPVADFEVREFLSIDPNKMRGEDRGHDYMTKMKRLLLRPTRLDPSSTRAWTLSDGVSISEINGWKGTDGTVYQVFVDEAMIVRSDGKTRLRLISDPHESCFAMDFAAWRADGERWIGHAHVFSPTLDLIETDPFQQALGLIRRVRALGFHHMQLALSVPDNALGKQDLFEAIQSTAKEIGLDLLLIETPARETKYNDTLTITTEIGVAYITTGPNKFTPAFRWWMPKLVKPATNNSSISPESLTLPRTRKLAKWLGFGLIYGGDNKVMDFFASVFESGKHQKKDFASLHENGNPTIKQIMGAKYIRISQWALYRWAQKRFRYFPPWVALVVGWWWGGVLAHWRYNKKARRMRDAEPEKNADWKALTTGAEEKLDAPEPPMPSRLSVEDIKSRLGTPIADWAGKIFGERGKEKTAAVLGKIMEVVHQPTLTPFLSSDIGRFSILFLDQDSNSIYLFIRHGTNFHFHRIDAEPFRPLNEIAGVQFSSREKQFIATFSKEYRPSSGIWRAKKFIPNSISQPRGIFGNVVDLLNDIDEGKKLDAAYYLTPDLYPRETLDLISILEEEGNDLFSDLSKVVSPEIQTKICRQLRISSPAQHEAKSAFRFMLELVNNFKKGRYPEKWPSEITQRFLIISENELNNISKEDYKFLEKNLPDIAGANRELAFKILNAVQRAWLTEIKMDRPISNISISPDGRDIAFNWTSDTSLTSRFIWQPAYGMLGTPLVDPWLPTIWHPNKPWAAVVRLGAPENLLVVDPWTGKLLDFSLPTFSSYDMDEYGDSREVVDEIHFKKFAWSPDGHQLAACDSRGGFYLWKINDRDFKLVDLPRLFHVLDFAWSPDNVLLLMDDPHQRLGDPAAPQLFAIGNPPGKIRDFAPLYATNIRWGPKGKWLFSETHRLGPIIWNLKLGISGDPRTFGEKARFEAWSSDDRFVYVRAEKGRLYQWDIESGGILPRSADTVRPGAKLSPNDRYLAFIDTQNGLCIYDNVRKLLAENLDVKVSAIDWHPDGTLFIGHTNGTMSSWRPEPISEHKSQFAPLVIAIGLLLMAIYSNDPIAMLITGAIVIVAFALTIRQSARKQPQRLSTTGPDRRAAMKTAAAVLRHGVPIPVAGNVFSDINPDDLAGLIEEAEFAIIRQVYQLLPFDPSFIRHQFFSSWAKQDDPNVIENLVQVGKNTPDITQLPEALSAHLRAHHPTLINKTKIFAAIVSNAMRPHLPFITKITTGLRQFTNTSADFIQEKIALEETLLRLLTSPKNSILDVQKAAIQFTRGFNNLIQKTAADFRTYAKEYRNHTREKTWQRSRLASRRLNEAFDRAGIERGTPVNQLSRRQVTELGSDVALVVGKNRTRFMLNPPTIHAVLHEELLKEIAKQFVQNTALTLPATRWWSGFFSLGLSWLLWRHDNMWTDWFASWFESRKHGLKDFASKHNNGNPTRPQLLGAEHIRLLQWHWYFYFKNHFAAFPTWVWNIGWWLGGFKAHWDYNHKARRMRNADPVKNADWKPLTLDEIPKLATANQILIGLEKSAQRHSIYQEIDATQFPPIKFEPVPYGIFGVRGWLDPNLGRILYVDWGEILATIIDPQKPVTIFTGGADTCIDVIIKARKKIRKQLHDVIGIAHLVSMEDDPDEPPQGSHGFLYKQYQRLLTSMSKWRFQEVRLHLSVGPTRLGIPENISQMTDQAKKRGFAINLIERAEDVLSDAMVSVNLAAFRHYHRDRDKATESKIILLDVESKPETLTLLRTRVWAKRLTLGLAGRWGGDNKFMDFFASVFESGKHQKKDFALLHENGNPTIKQIIGAKYIRLSQWSWYRWAQKRFRYFPPRVALVAGWWLGGVLAHWRYNRLARRMRKSDPIANADWKALTIPTSSRQDPRVEQLMPHVINVFSKLPQEIRTKLGTKIEDVSRLMPLVQLQSDPYDFSLVQTYYQALLNHVNPFDLSLGAFDLCDYLLADFDEDQRKTILDTIELLVPTGNPYNIRQLDKLIHRLTPGSVRGAFVEILRNAKKYSGNDFMPGDQFLWRNVKTLFQSPGMFINHAEIPESRQKQIVALLGQQIGRRGAQHTRDIMDDIAVWMNELNWDDARFITYKYQPDVFYVTGLSKIHPGLRLFYRIAHLEYDGYTPNDTIDEEIRKLERQRVNNYDSLLASAGDFRRIVHNEYMPTKDRPFHHREHLGFLDRRCITSLMFIDPADAELKSETWRKLKDLGVLSDEKTDLVLENTVETDRSGTPLEPFERMQMPEMSEPAKPKTEPFDLDELLKQPPVVYIDATGKVQNGPDWQIDEDTPEPALSPDESLLVLCARQSGTGRWDLLIFNRDPQTGELSSPRWRNRLPGVTPTPIFSPDGTRLMVTTVWNRSNGFLLYSIPAMGNSKSEVFEVPGLASNIKPVIGLEDNILVKVLRVLPAGENATRDVWGFYNWDPSIPFEASDANLVAGPFDVTNRREYWWIDETTPEPVYTPDRRELVFVGNYLQPGVERRYALFTKSAPPNSDRRLTDDNGNMETGENWFLTKETPSPVFTPDGKHLLVKAALARNEPRAKHRFLVFDWNPDGSLKNPRWLFHDASQTASGETWVTDRKTPKVVVAAKSNQLIMRAGFFGSSRNTPSIHRFIVWSKPSGKRANISNDVFASIFGKRIVSETIEAIFFQPFLGLSVVVAWIAFANGMVGPPFLAILIGFVLDIFTHSTLRALFVGAHRQRSFETNRDIYRQHDRDLSKPGFRQKLKTAFDRLNNDLLDARLHAVLKVFPIFFGLLFMLGGEIITLVWVAGFSWIFLVSTIKIIRLHIRRNDQFRQNGPTDINVVLMTANPIIAHDFFLPFLRVITQESELTLEKLRHNFITAPQLLAGIQLKLAESGVRRTDQTEFFRYKGDWLPSLNTFLDDLVASKWKGDKKIRVRHISGSVGREPYSCAIALHTALLNLHHKIGDPMPFEIWIKQWDIRIDSFDIEFESLLKTSQGIYDYNNLAQIQRADIDPFLHIETYPGGQFRMVKLLRDWVRPTFIDLNDPAQLGILESDRYDVTFSMTTFMYLRQSVKTKILDVILRSTPHQTPALMVLREQALYTQPLTVRFESNGRWDPERNPSAVKSINEILRMPPDDIKPQYIRPLGIAPMRESIPFLRALLTHPNRQVAMAAAWSLARVTAYFGEPAVAPARNRKIAAMISEIIDVPVERVSNIDGRGVLMKLEESSVPNENIAIAVGDASVDSQSFIMLMASFVNQIPDAGRHLFVLTNTKQDADTLTARFGTSLGVIVIAPETDGKLIHTKAINPKMVLGALKDRGAVSLIVTPDIHNTSQLAEWLKTTNIRVMPFDQLLPDIADKPNWMDWVRAALQALRDA